MQQRGEAGERGPFERGVERLAADVQGGGALHGGLLCGDRRGEGGGAAHVVRDEQAARPFELEERGPLARGCALRVAHMLGVRPCSGSG